MVAIVSAGNAAKVFFPVRFSGQNYLKKRQFEKVTESRRNVLNYKGRETVVVSRKTSIIMEYSEKQQKVIITFFLQRYDKEDFALDLQLQALCNSSD